jgi:hypothetical protein
MVQWPDAAGRSHCRVIGGMVQWPLLLPVASWLLCCIFMYSPANTFEVVAINAGVNSANVAPNSRDFFMASHLDHYSQPDFFLLPAAYPLHNTTTGSEGVILVKSMIQPRLLQTDGQMKTDSDVLGGLVAKVRGRLEKLSFISSSIGGTAEGSMPAANAWMLHPWRQWIFILPLENNPVIPSRTVEYGRSLPFNGLRWIPEK